MAWKPLHTTMTTSKLNSFYSFLIFIHFQNLMKHNICSDSLANCNWVKDLLIIVHQWKMNHGLKVAGWNAWKQLTRVFWRVLTTRGIILWWNLTWQNGFFRWCWFVCKINKFWNWRRNICYFYYRLWNRYLIRDISSSSDTVKLGE